MVTFELNDTQKSILLKLHQKYPEWTGKDSLLKELDIPEEELMKDIDILEENRLIEAKWHIGGFFNTRITLDGRNQI